MKDSHRGILGAAFWTAGVAATYTFADTLEHPYYILFFLVALLITEAEQAAYRNKFEKWYFITAIVFSGVGFSRAVEPMIDEMIRSVLTNIAFMIGITMLFGKRVYSMMSPNKEVTEIGAHGV